MRLFLIRVSIAFIFYHIIAMLWTIAEIKLYGWTLPSIIDSLAACTIALGAADIPIGMLKEAIK